LKGGTLAVEGSETRVWAAADPADPDRIRSRALPAKVVEALSGRPSAS
jgi:hypothetical protein